MLQKVCEYLHNYFVREPNPGSYTISAGVISPAPSLIEGQRIWIVGSALNDGIYTYHADGIKDDDDNESAELSDETFDGCVCAMAVPKGVLSVVNDISNWLDQYGDAVNSPYTSESFGGYSYTKKSGTDAHGNDVTDWKSVFGKALNTWRKIA